MNLLQCRSCFQLEHNCAFDEEVDTMFSDWLRPIEDRHRFLALELDTEFTQFDRERFLVKGLKKARA